MVGIIRSEVFLFRQRKMIFVNICAHHYFPFPLHHNIMSSQNYCFPSNKHNFDRLVQWILVHLWITRRIFSFFVFCLIYPSHSVLHQALQKVKFSQSPLLSLRRVGIVGGVAGCYFQNCITFGIWAGTLCRTGWTLRPACCCPPNPSLET